MTDLDEKQADEKTECRLREIYGAAIAVSHAGAFALVHLDEPDVATLARRTEEFDPDDYFVDNCRICLERREAGGYFIFDSRRDTDFDEYPAGPYELAARPARCRPKRPRRIR